MRTDLVVIGSQAHLHVTSETDTQFEFLCELQHALRNRKSKLQLAIADEVGCGCPEDTDNHTCGLARIRRHIALANKALGEAV